MIDYKNDPLLKSGNKNIYSCLFRTENDLKDKNFCLRTPTINIVNKSKIIKLTEKKYGTVNKGFLLFIKQLENYLGIKFASLYKTKYKYFQLFKNNQANLVFLRVISLCLSKNNIESINLFKKFVIKNEYIKIKKLKLTVSNFNQRISYLVGVISGDGHLNKTETGLIIVDGQSEKKKRKDSKIYIEFIYNLFKKEFNLNGKITKHKTWWMYSIYNKWLCRFINCYFEIPFGKKSDKIKFPKTLEKIKEQYFWRGMMDTDGFINEKKQYMSLKSNSMTLIYQFKDFCNKNNIKVYIKKEKCWVLNIPSCNFLNYAKLVGFSHPRKKRVLINHLKKSPRYKVLKNVNKDLPSKIIELFEYLRPYKISVYIKLNKHHRKGRKQDINNLLNLIKTTFKVKIIEVRRNRYNNHFHICSKKFTEFVKNNATYDLPWQPLNSLEIKKLLKEWTL